MGSELSPLASYMSRYFAGQTQWERPTAAAGLSGPFVPSATFTGRAEGYVFKMGSKGLGYYQDTGPFGGVPIFSTRQDKAHLQPVNFSTFC